METKMADNNSGFGLAPAPGEDNSSVVQKAANVAQANVPTLPIMQAVRAVRRAISSPSRDDIAD
jgi:hypothetical protein